VLLSDDIFCNALQNVHCKFNARCALWQELTLSPGLPASPTGPAGPGRPCQSWMSDISCWEDSVTRWMGRMHTRLLQLYLMFCLWQWFPTMGTTKGCMETLCFCFCLHFLHLAVNCQNSSSYRLSFSPTVLIVFSLKVIHCNKNPFYNIYDHA